MCPSDLKRKDNSDMSRVCSPSACPVPRTCSSRANEKLNFSGTRLPVMFRRYSEGIANLLVETFFPPEVKLQTGRSSNTDKVARTGSEDQHSLVFLAQLFSVFPTNTIPSLLQPPHFCVCVCEKRLFLFRFVFAHARLCMSMHVCVCGCFFMFSCF